MSSGTRLPRERLRPGDSVPRSRTLWFSPLISLPSSQSTLHFCNVWTIGSRLAKQRKKDTPLPVPLPLPVLPLPSPLLLLLRLSPLARRIPWISVQGEEAPYLKKRKLNELWRDAAFTVVAYATVYALALSNPSVEMKLPLPLPLLCLPLPLPLHLLPHFRYRVILQPSKRKWRVTTWS